MKSSSNALCLEDQPLISDIGEHLQAGIARKLATTDLARLRVVNKLWKAVVDREEVLRASFLRTWSLADVQGRPNNLNFFLTAGLGHFVLRTKLGPKSSIASLVVGFKTDSVTLRVLNNCTSDFSLQCRPYVFVPVTDKCALLDRTATFTLDALCGRQLVELIDATEDAAAGTKSPSPALESADGALCALARRNAAASDAEATPHCADTNSTADLQRDALLKKLSRHMGKGLHIDEGTASYYLGLADGDIKRAFLMYKEDLAWEDGNPVGQLPLRSEPQQDSM